MRNISFRAVVFLSICYMEMFQVAKKMPEKSNGTMHLYPLFRILNRSDAQTYDLCGKKC